MAKENNTLAPIDVPLYNNGSMPVLSIQGIGHFTRSFENKSTSRKDSYLLIFCNQGKGFYLHHGKNGIIEKGHYMIIKESDEFSCGVYLLTNEMRLFVFSFCYPVTYTITTKNPEIILTDINSRIYGGRNIFLRAYNMLVKENPAANLPYATTLLMGFIEAERYARNEQINIIANRSELVEKAIQYMYDNIQKDITIAELLELLGCSRSKLFAHFMKYKTTRPLEFLNKIRIKRACKLLTDTSLHVNEICREVGINNPVYFSRLFTKVVGMSPTDYRRTYRLTDL